MNLTSKLKLAATGLAALIIGNQPGCAITVPVKKPTPQTTLDLTVDQKLELYTHQLYYATMRSPSTEQTQPPTTDGSHLYVYTLTINGQNTQTTVTVTTFEPRYTDRTVVRLQVHESEYERIPVDLSLKFKGDEVALPKYVSHDKAAEILKKAVDDHNASRPPYK